MALMTTLQQRIADVLRDSSHEYASDDSEANAVDTIFDLLQKAEADLHAVQTRVDNLKWQLAKVQEHET